MYTGWTATSGQSRCVWVMTSCAMSHGSTSPLSVYTRIPSHPAASLQRAMSSTSRRDTRGEAVYDGGQVANTFNPDSMSRVVMLPHQPDVGSVRRSPAPCARSGLFSAPAVRRRRVACAQRHAATEPYRGIAYGFCGSPARLLTRTLTEGPSVEYPRHQRVRRLHPFQAGALAQLGRA